MSSLFLFTGENAYAMREEKRRWMEEFALKHGPENLIRLEGGEVTLRSLLDEVGVAPFLGEKRLVLVEGIPSFGKGELELLLQGMHGTCLLVFLEPKPDKRLIGVKELLKVATVKTFPMLTGQALDQWMQALILSLGSSLEPAAREALRRVSGGDQLLLAEEIKKLSLYAGGRSITQGDVEEMVVPCGEQEVWHLADLLSQGKEPESLLYAESLLLRGKSPQALWGSLLWMLQNLVWVAAAVAGGERNIAAIVKSTGVPFPSVRSLLPFASTVRLERLQDLLDWASAADIGVKTGGYRATGEAPEELEALIDRFIVACCAAAGTALVHDVQESMPCIVPAEQAAKRPVSPAPPLSAR